MRSIKFFLRKAAALGALALLAACQHGIDPDKLEYPPEFDESGIASSKLSPAEINKELEELAKVPYPPYRIQGGDVFRVRVYNESELDSAGSSAVVVTPDGYLVVGLIDPINVKNLTIVEATEKVREALQKYIKYPRVSVIPEKIQGKQATLFGSVREPGVYPVTDNTRLTDFVSQGRGYAVGILDNTTVDLADINNSYIIRDSKILPVNFNEALMKGNQLHNVRIFPDDIVYIAKREDSRVMIMGEVNIPRSMNWDSSLTILDLIANAGGLKPDYWGTALVLRRPKDVPGGPLNVYRIDLDDLFSGKFKNFKLASGDIVYIPKDSLGEYNVFIQKLIPTATLINLLMSPPAYWFGPNR